MCRAIRWGFTRPAALLGLALLVGLALTAWLVVTRPASSGSSSAPGTCEVPTEAKQPLLRDADPCFLQTLAHLSPPTPAPSPTLRPVMNLADAATRAAPWFFGAYGDSFSEVDRVTYVRSTVGVARDYFSPNARIQPHVEDHVPAWVFVASGRFQKHCLPCSEQPSVQAAVVVIVPANGELLLVVTSETPNDLTALGTPREVPSAVLYEQCDRHIQSAGQERWCGTYEGPRREAMSIATPVPTVVSNPASEGEME